MTTAFQRNAFQTNQLAWQIDMSVQGNNNTDQSGESSLRITTGLGPTLGQLIEQIKPQVYVTSPGIWNIVTASVILVIAGGAVTLQLPDVTKWLKQPNYNPYTAFERSIWIKDYGGNASNFNITIQPFAGQLIDGLASLVITSNRFLVRLHPLPDLSGWWAA